MATKKQAAVKPDTKTTAKPGIKKAAAKPKVTVEPAVTADVVMDVKALRQQLGLNQSQFWSKVHVTQSGGSRYENERSVPKPVQALLALAYGPEPQAKALFESLRKRDVEVA